MPKQKKDPIQPAIEKGSNRHQVDTNLQLNDNALQSKNKEVSSKLKKETRGRNFACVVYPESAPDNWKDILSDLHITCAISPLHDMDFNPTGEPKKPHYHVLMVFEGHKSYDQIKSLCDPFGGVVDPLAVQSVRGYARYLCHLDNPEKAQYSISDVLTFGGFDFISEISTYADKYRTIREMVQWCRDNGIKSYHTLFNYAMDYEPSWFNCLCDTSTMVIKEYLKSKSWSEEHGTHVPPVLDEDGNIIKEGYYKPIE